MRATRFVITCLFLLFPALSATAMEPMNEAEMDSVQAQSGIAIALDNIQIYNHSGWAYEDTSLAANKIEFKDMASYMILDTRNPLTFRVMINPNDVAMMELTGQPSIWMEMNTNDFFFADKDMGSLHLSLRPPDGNRMGFIEEFALYVAPLGTQADFTGDGIAFQLEARSGLEEFRWDYNQADADEFRLGGVHMAGSFTDTDSIDTDPATWAPQGHFRIGNLNAYETTNPLGPGTFQIVQDETDPDYAFIRMNLPMEGSVRIEEIGMFADPENDGTFVQDDFGPMIVDGMRVDHFQMDIRTN